MTDDPITRLQAEARERHAQQPKRRKSWPFVAAGALAALGAVGVVVGLTAGGSSGAEAAQPSLDTVALDETTTTMETLVDVFVVHELVPKGADAETIKASVSVQSIPARLMQPNDVVNLDEVDGTVAAIDMQPGDQLQTNGLVPPDTVEAASAGALQETAESCTDPMAVHRSVLSHEGITVNVFKASARRLNLTEDQMIIRLMPDVYDESERTLSIDGAWAIDSGDATAILTGVVYDCVIDALDLPRRVADHINHTRAIDGTQTDTWDDYNARFTYHPDNGASITIWET